MKRSIDLKRQVARISEKSAKTPGVKILKLAWIQNSPNQRIDSSTSNAYFMSPSTRPGVSTKVTRLNFFCFDVEISVVK